MISQQSQIRVAAVATLLAVYIYIYDVIELEWSKGHSDYLADHSSIQILNWISNIFRLFYSEAAGNDRILMRVFSLHAIVGCDHR